MLYEAISDSPVLKFNMKHRNFNETGQLLTKGSTIEGQAQNIQGKRRGNPFTYRVIQVSINNNNRFIYSNNLKAMNNSTIEVKSAAVGDSVVIEEQSSKAAGDSVIIEKTKTSMMPSPGEAVMTVLGAIGGYFIAKKKQKNKLLFTIGGAVAGYGLSKVVLPNVIKVIKKK